MKVKWFSKTIVLNLCIMVWALSSAHFNTETRIALLSWAYANLHLRVETNDPIFKDKEGNRISPTWSTIIFIIRISKKVFMLFKGRL